MRGLSELSGLRRPPRAVEAVFDPSPVGLAPDNSSTEAGEDVTVIGNPGLGKEILKHTITTGVVSSPERWLDGQTYIQTSAAVNARASRPSIVTTKP